MNTQPTPENYELEQRFKTWLENRDDDFELDIWDFRCLQDFLSQERKTLLEGIVEEFKEKEIDWRVLTDETARINTLGYNQALQDAIAIVQKHLTD